MAVVIQLRVPEKAGGGRYSNVKKEWEADHLSDLKMPDSFDTCQFDFEGVWSLYVSGQDFEDIKKAFTNVPYPNYVTQCSWAGEMAAFIIDNIQIMDFSRQPIREKAL